MNRIELELDDLFELDKYSGLIPLVEKNEVRIFLTYESFSEDASYDDEFGLAKRQQLVVDERSIELEIDFNVHFIRVNNKDLRDVLVDKFNYLIRKCDNDLLL